VVANQADEVVVLDKTGKTVAKLGDFNGLDEQGAPRGLLFPAEMTKIGDYLYVENLSVDGVDGLTCVFLRHNPLTSCPPA
jgi:hypothetical protein